MKFISYLFLALLSLFIQNSLAQQKLTLPNGWSLSPAGRSLPLGDLPLNMAVSRSRKLLAVTNNGESVHTLQLINVKQEKIVDDIVIPKAWLGLQFSANEKYLYAAGGNDNWILKYAIDKNKLLLTDSFSLGAKWPNKISPGGIALDDERQLLYVVTKEDNSLYTIDLATKHFTQLKLDGEGYTCLLSPDKKQLYISCWGCDKVIVYDTEQNTITTQLPVGDNPNELCLTKNGSYLFVANSNDNAVSVIDTKQQKVIETLTASLYPNAPPGSTTNGLALSADERTLYIANADNNCLAVFDVRKPGFSKSKGFIPTGWYPTCVKVIGKKIFVTNGKGFSSMADPNGPNPANIKRKVIYQGEEVLPKEQYIGSLFKGTMSIIDVPDEKQLSGYSQQVYANTPYTKTKETLSEGLAGNPIPTKAGEVSPIKHVFYIVKENRTYDQVLGDVKEGNGDTSLVLFGERITPNQHQLAKDFVLLDNFYVDGEVSADGHEWSLGAYATDYLEKTWPTSYGGRGGSFASEGSRPVANNKGDYIWGSCKRAGISYRTYAEFADDSKANLPVLEGHVCNYFTGWNQKVRDTVRFNQWKRDFDSLVAINAVPQLNTLRFINDHTEGMRNGRPSPFAHVADNDLAVGMFIDYLSKSPVWKESVVFIVEDDAQNGPDHVDAHRSPAYVIGPYVKRNFVDHTAYTTSGILRTMELILGLPPMSQYDAAAMPLFRSFTPTPDLSVFNHLPNNVSLEDKNIVWNDLSKKAAQFDLTKEDKVPDLQFTENIWKGVKGLDAKVPAPKRAAFVKAIVEEED